MNFSTMRITNIRLTWLSICSLAVLPLSALGQSGEVIPNSWNNPDFQKRVIGSYGVRSEIEPEALTRDEARFFNENILPLVNDGNMTEATRLLEQNITPESNANFDYILGTLYLQSGNMDRAVSAYEAAIKKVPEYLRAYKNLGIAYTQMGKYEQAVNTLSKSIELGESSGDTYGLLGYNYFNLGQHMQALDSYRMATVLNPKNKDWLVGKTQSLMEVGEFKEALQAALELLEKEPQDYRYWLTRANANIGLQDYIQAILNLEMAKKLGDPPLRSHILLGDLYLSEGISPLALKAYKDAIPLGLGTRDFLRILNTFIGQMDYQEAREFVQAANVDVSGWDAEDRQALLVMRSQVALGLGEEDASIDLLEQVVQENPLNGQALLQLAEYYRKQDNREESVYYYERAAALTDQDIRFEALVQMATYATEVQEYAKARDLVRQALGIRDEARLASYLEALDRIVEREQS